MALVRRARRGLRRDVAALEAGLDEGELYVPLASGIRGARDGETLALDHEVEIVPHFVVDEEGHRFVALFTLPDFVEPIAEALRWQTDGDELGVCRLPGRVACELALSVIDEVDVHGLVIDPGQNGELLLRRSELASIVAGQPVPLVGYLEDLPPLEDEKVLVAEPTELPAGFVAALEHCLARLGEVRRHRLERTFNPERDLEPHLTLRLAITATADRRLIGTQVISAVGELVPPPGYIDVLFEDA